MLTPQARPAVAALPVYRPGRSAEVAMAEHGIADAVKLASNESPFGPLPAALAAAEAAAAGAHRYPDHRAGALRSRLAEHLGVDAGRVAVGAGSAGLIQQLAVAYCEPGVASVAHGWPSFESYPIATQLMAATPLAVPLRRQTIDAAALAAAVDGSCALVLVATPNNPTGTALRREELVALADAIPPTTLLVVDEAYHEFVTGADVPDSLQLLGDRPNVCVLRTFSKAYGLAALRVGYLVGPPEVVDAVDRTLSPFAVSGPGQAAALASLDAHDLAMERVAAVVAERDRLAAALWDRGLGVPDPQGNFVWLPAGAGAGPLAVALEQRGVVTRPFAGSGVRVTATTPQEGDRFLQALDDVAAAFVAGWQLPAGREAEEPRSWLRRLDAVEARLAGLASRRRDGLTEADAATGERWDDGQVWAHIGEFGAYWLRELDAVLAGASGFGRTKADPARIGAIEDGRQAGPAPHLAAARRAMDGLRARLSELTVEDWAAKAEHPTLGTLSIAEQLQHFHIGHYEEHADQLESIA